MDHAIMGPLCKDKLVLLVTYDLDQAAAMEHVLLMDKGAVQRYCPSEDFF